MLSLKVTSTKFNDGSTALHMMKVRDEYHANEMLDILATYGVILEVSLEDVA